MADEVITGKEGVISLDAGDVDVTAFTITVTGGIIDTTDSSDASGGFRSKIPGKFKEWTGTAELFLKSAASEIVTNESVAFIGTADTSTATITYTGTISIAEVTDTIPVEEIGRASCRERV